jgi:hypothetical protein
VSEALEMAGIGTKKLKVFFEFIEEKFEEQSEEHSERIPEREKDEES